MPDQFAQDYQALLPILHSIPAATVERARIPSGQLVLEAMNLQRLANTDRTVLEPLLRDWSLVESLDQRCGALMHAQALWDVSRCEYDRTLSEWQQLQDDARDTARELKRAFGYAYRNDRKVVAKISALSRGYSNNDLIQRLKAYATIGAAHPQPLTAIGFDPQRLERAGALAHRMTDVHGQVKAGSARSHATEMRDRAHTYLASAMREVRSAGKYAFAGHPDRAREYASEYMRRPGRMRQKTATRAASMMPSAPS